MAKPISELAKTLTEDQLVDYVGKILEEKILKILPKKIKLRNLTAAKLREMKKAGITGPELEAMMDRVKSVSSKIKKLKRGLGGVILTNPEHYKKTGLFKRILAGKRGTVASILTTDNWFNELDSALGSWDGSMHNTGASNRFNPVGKVGHHRTALSVMRDALLEQPEGVRARFKELALADGYKVGEEFVDYIDPVAHKGLNKTIHGKLKEKGYLKKGQIDEKVMKELVDRSAHSKLFGDTTGFNFPKELVTKNASAEDIYKAARPYLEMNRMAADQGLAFDKIVTEGKWNTPEELLDLVKANAEIDAKKTEALVNRMNVDLYEAGYIQPDGTTTIKGKSLTDRWGTKRGDLVPDPVSRGQTIEDIYKNVWEPVDARGLRGLTRQIEPVTESGQVLFSKTNDFSDAVKPVGGGVAALTADSFAPTGYNKLTEQAQKVGNKLVEAKDAANLKQLSTIGKRAAMLNPLMFGASTGLGALALQDRIKEVAANPDDPWLKFQLRLDQAALGADATGLATSAAALTGWGALAPAAAEITSNVASGASLALDFGRWVKDPQAREDTLEWWTSVYQRGSRGLIKGLQQVF